MAPTTDLATSPETMNTANGWQGTTDDQHFEQVLGTLLIYGVIAAASVVLLGGILYLARHGAEVPNYHRFQGDYRSVRGIVSGALTGRGRGFIQVGILMLVATPVARVVARAVRASAPDLRYTVGPTMQRLAPLIRGVLPFSVYEKMMPKHYGL